jgi:serine/threonine protein kinase/WD40 repeat protein
MIDSSEDGRDPVEVLAEEFLERRRRGEAPALAEYLERYPDLADDIRDVFPALLLMDEIDPNLRELSPHADGPPRQIGDYRLVRRIGAGGMGVVYEAEQLSLGRCVALKVLSPQALGDSKAQERFRREARSAAQLHHTNIVPVFEVGQEGGVSYYAMQLIAGPSLDQVIRELRRQREQATTGRLDETPAATVPMVAPVEDEAPAAVSQAASSLLSGLREPAGRVVSSSTSPSVGSGSSVNSVTATLGVMRAGHRPYYRSVAHIGQQMALALAHAHARGIVHRDVKPSNLLLDESGVVWMTDFGLAKTEDDNLTRTGELAGTLRYMAPERFQGECDARTDIYALGLTLYELLVLGPAFPANDRLHLMEYIRNREPPRPRAVDGRIPRDLETVILKAIEKDPRRRYQSSDELAADLQRFLADEPIRARRTPWYERGWRWCRRNPGWAAMLTFCFLLLTAMAVGGLALSVSLKSALDKSQQAERDRKQQLFESLVAKAEAQRFSGHVGQRFATLDAIRKASQLAHELDLPASAFDDLRNLAVAALALPDLYVTELPDGWPEGTRQVIFDESYEQYARRDDQGNLTIRRVADDFEIAHRTIDPTDILDRFDEGQRAVILGDLANSSWQRWRFDENEIVSLGHLPAGFSKNDATITTADHQLEVTLVHKTGTLGVYEAATGRHLHNIPIGRWPSSDYPLGGFLWSMHPWRHELAITMGSWDDPERGRVDILDLDKGTILAGVLSDGRLHGLAWHPDGRTLGLGYVNNVNLWDVPDKKQVGRIKDHKGSALQVGMSRSGQLLSTYSEWAGGLKLWHPYTGKPLLSVPGTGVHPTHSAPDGRMFAVEREGKRLKIWATEPSPVLRALVRIPALGAPGLYQGTSIHPGGRLLAVGSDGGVSLFDLFTGLDVGHLDVEFDKTVRFDPVTGDLFTFSTLGLWRWPVRTDANDPGRLTIGPPKRMLREPATDHELRISADGKTIAVTEYNQVVVFHADQPEDRPIVLEPVSTVRQQVSLTPDGRWIATGCHGGGDVCIWDGRTGQLVKTEAGHDQRCCVLFTPDGKRLLVNSPKGCRFWRTGDWEEVPPRMEQGDNKDVFTPDGRFLVCEKGDGQLRLLDTTTGREVVRLGNPDQGRCNFSSMSGDGRFLATINGDYTDIRVWDMHELRRQLRKMDLDWDSHSDLPAGNGPGPLPPPLQVAIDYGAMSSLLKKWYDAFPLNQVAWDLVTTTPKKRDPKRAIQLIEKALRDFPDNPMFSNTLGVAQYRSGLYKEAIATLERNMAVNHGYNAAQDLFCLAMCYHKLGEGDRARDCYDRGAKWMSDRTELAPGLDKDLKLFRAEAEQTLKSPSR